MDFIIDRSKWICGHDKNRIQQNYPRFGNGTTLLLNTHGFMCCLGQVCKQMGISDDDLLSQADPTDVVFMHEFHKKDNDIKNKLSFLIENRDIVTDNSELADKAIAINDTDMPAPLREEKLVELFKEYGHTISFVGEYVPSTK